MNVHRERGFRLLELKRYELAAAEFRAAAAMEPNDSTVHALLATCLLGLGHDAEAEREAETAVGCDADDPYALYTLSRAKMACDKYREAFAAIEACLRLAPMDADYLFFRAALLHDVGRFQDALQAANEALRQDPNHVRAANLRILALQASDRFDEADLEIDRVLKINPEFAWSHETKGRIALRNGRIAEALTHYREALRLNPHEEAARRGLVEALKSRNFFYRILMWLFPPAVGDLLTRGALVSIVIGSLGGLAYARFSPHGRHPGSPVPTMMAGTVIAMLAYLFLFLAMQRFGDAFFVFLLRFDRIGRTVLTIEERRRAEITTGCLLAALGCIAASFALAIPWLIIVALAILIFVLPASIALFMTSERAARRSTLLAGATMASIPAVIVGMIIAFPKTPAIGIFAGLAWVGVLLFFKRRRDSDRTIG